MKLWPWAKADASDRDETRNYSDALTAALIGAVAGDPTIKATATGALEAAAGFIGRSFASAEVKGSAMAIAALPPPVLAHMARALVSHGETLWLIRTDGGRLRLAPAQSWDVLGDPDEATWRYRVTLGGASTVQTFESVSGEGVVHIRYSYDAREPWRGIGPLTQARLAGRLSSQLSAALGDEVASTRGSFLPVPADGDDPTIAQMKADAATAKGRMLFVEGGDWDNPGGDRKAGWEQKRFGAAPPDALVELHKLASAEVWAAVGLNPGLFTAEGETAARESYRQALHSCIAPLGRLVEHELSMKLEEAVSLSWQEMRAGDIQTKARSYKQLVESGIDPRDAASNTGITLDHPVREPAPSAPPSGAAPDAGDA